MASEPDGDPAPADGSLPETARSELGRASFGVYVHVPFCTSRCGYCDFNTYTPAELSRSDDDDAVGDQIPGYLAAAAAELKLAGRVLAGESGELPEAATVFFGGGTPSLLAPDQLRDVLARIDDTFGLADDAEVTMEANPESCDRQRLAGWRAAGVNRISFGMQSADVGVLRVLDRKHSPGRPAQAVSWAREAGFDSISLDLIYGTPGETVASWQGSVRSAIAAGVDHVSAYALIIEDGTAMARRIRRGELAAPDDDDQADKYLIADDLLTEAGFAWYEVSNWARWPEHRCRHNEIYWRSDNWWGIGPGAHSHVGGVRWWNLRHPRAYAEALAQDRSPAKARETLDGETRRIERILLETRLTDGLDPGLLDDAGRAGLATCRDRDWIDPDRIVLTRSGRLMADAVVRDLIG